MAMISLDEAATRLGLTREAIEEWEKTGLLQIHPVVTGVENTPTIAGLAVRLRQVDEEELAQVAESLGWLQLSSEGWDNDEGE